MREGLHPVQQRLAVMHGSQCGFCTPGFVMSMYSLLRSCEEPPTEEDIEDALGGNLWYDTFETAWRAGTIRRETGAGGGYNEPPIQGPFVSQNFIDIVVRCLPWRSW